MTSATQDICIVGCTKMKRMDRAAARDLYDPSPLFRGRRTYVELEHPGTPWVIMSALYGIVLPTNRIDPYDMTMRDRRLDDDYGRWCRRLVVNLLAYSTDTRRSPTTLRLEVHAGGEYVAAIRNGAEQLQQQIIGRYAFELELTTPAAGLGIGQQKAFYARHADRVRSIND